MQDQLSPGNTHLVTYDMSDDKRLRRIFPCLNGYGDPVQYSVFRCDLSALERILMIEAVTEIIHHDEDQVVVVNLGPLDGQATGRIEVLDRPAVPPQRGVVVV